MSRAFASALSVDPWAPVVGQRLGGLYAGSPASLSRLARSLYAALTVNYLQTRADETDVFLFVPCSSYDECLAWASLPQVIRALGGNVFPVLLLPDAAAQEMAIHRASRDNLSRLMYFLDARLVDASSLLEVAMHRGAALVLRCAETPDPERLGRLVPGRVPRGLALCLAEQGDADQLHRLALPGTGGVPETGPAARGTGFRLHLAATGELIAVSHGWLESLQNLRRSDPILMASRQPTQRVWFDLAGAQVVGAGAPFAPSLEPDLDPARITCFANHASPGNDLVFGFALGHGCRLAYAEDQPYDDTPGTSLVWGVLRGSDNVVRSAIDAGRSFIYCDHAYFGRGHLLNYRIVLNGHATTLLRRCPDDRTAALGVTLRPWRVQGRHVLVCPPTPYFMQAHGCPNWLDNTLSTLRRHTERPIIVRDKPKPGEQARTLEEDLQDCHALVTHSSNVAVEAAVYGVPVFVAPTCAAIGVGRSELAQIERPATPDRRLWLANLAYSQFSFDEILKGRVLSLIADYWEREQA